MKVCEYNTQAAESCLQGRPENGSGNLTRSFHNVCSCHGMSHAHATSSVMSSSLAENFEATNLEVVRTDKKRALCTTDSADQE